MRITAKTTREQLVAAVVEELRKAGVSAVLVGGAVVSIYTENKYESHDLDFISNGDPAQIEKAMKELGFRRKGRGFLHSAAKFSVEFPLGPIAIGNEEPVLPEGELKVGKVKIKLLSPTQSIMDRLAWFYHANDRQCLDQAVMIARSQRAKINFEKIASWSQSEGAGEKFEVFMKRVKA